MLSNTSNDVTKKAKISIWDENMNNEENQEKEPVKKLDASEVLNTEKSDSVISMPINV